MPSIKTLATTALFLCPAGASGAAFRGGPSDSTIALATSPR